MRLLVLGQPAMPSGWVARVISAQQLLRPHCHIRRLSPNKTMIPTLFIERGFLTGALIIRLICVFEIVLDQCLNPPVIFPRSTTWTSLKTPLILQKLPCWSGISGLHTCSPHLRKAEQSLQKITFNKSLLYFSVLTVVFLGVVCYMQFLVL